MISVGKWPAGAQIGAQTVVTGLGVEHDQAHVAQIGKLGRGLPWRHLAQALISILS